jgi:hypothetical protein
VLLTKYYSGDQIKMIEMGRTCSLYGARGDAYRVLGENPERRNHLENTSLGGRIKLNWIFKKWDGVHGLD